MTKQKQEKKSTNLKEIIWRADKFGRRDIPSRGWIVKGAIPAPGIGMLYAWRGSGKTLVAMDLALRVARGEPWLNYPVPIPRGVLYVDGEMPLGDLRDRLVAQAGPAGPPQNLFILASEDLAVEHRSLNLVDHQDRDDISRLLVDIEKDYSVAIQLVIFDNWTTLVRGIDENDSSLIDPLKQWLILLRHGEKSALFVHHAGKSGGQRGSSAREDVIDYSIKLTGSNGPENFEWDKTRTARPDPDNFPIRLLRVDNQWLKLVRAAREEKGPAPKYDEIILAWLAENGPHNPAEVGEALDIPKKTCYRCFGRLAKAQSVTLLADGKYSHS